MEIKGLKAFPISDIRLLKSSDIKFIGQNFALKLNKISQIFQFEKICEFGLKNSESEFQTKRIDVSTDFAFDQEGVENLLLGQLHLVKFCTFSDYIFRQALFFLKSYLNNMYLNSIWKASSMQTIRIKLIVKVVCFQVKY